ncbi:MAG TPA: BMP family ABC transporter substrate-binding protein [Spirochaetia bacterium]|nr:BMP family ABC transporter substrate-binding protein [Spirochaetia bacterium]
MKKLVLVAVVFLAATGLWAGGSSETPQADLFSIGVFVPGVVEGSPTYELLVAGVAQAVEESGLATSKVVEGGFNQALWEQSLTSMAASGEYDLIVSSNPEIPDIVVNVLEAFPEQHFLLLDAFLEGNERVHTVMFNQREQAFLAGYFAGLVGQSSMAEPRETLRAGLLAGQEYPIMNDVIVPGYELGLRSVDPDATVDFRVLGNWYDAGRAAELANSMYATGSHIILPIAGGGNQGVIASARDRDAYVVWYDTPGLDEAPGVVIGSTFVALDRATYQRTLEAIEEELDFGRAEVLGVADGYVGFVDDDPLYERHVDEIVRNEMARMLSRMQSGEVSFEMPLR